MGYKLELKEAQILAKADVGNKAAQKWLDGTVLKNSEAYIPMQTGSLMDSGQIGTDVGSGKIVYNAPYARAQYYLDNNKSKNKHPKASFKWFEKAKAIHLTKWIAGAKKLGGIGFK